MSDTLPTPSPTIGRKRSPAHQILTLFGDYWWGVPESLPTGAVLASMADLGVKAPAARASLARLTDRGLLEMTKTGRRTSHALTDRGRAIMTEEADWLRRFGQEDPDWDGLWSAIFFSIPEKNRPLRHAARTRLRWLGYAPLYDGVWISPFDSVSRITAELASLGVLEIASLRGALTVATGDTPMRAWDLTSLRGEYEEFLARLGDCTEPVVAGPHPHAALALRTSFMLTWQSFRHADPGHPMTLMPPDWPRARAREAFVSIYNALGPAAEERVRAHIAQIAPGLDGLVTSQRFG
ncbi:MAG: PaaX family transcriptional regulator [Microbacterium sp.]|uniref:PaaX family transcriptional regulator n=1 Tax=Microbacterium sp. TaxID=51671 RepID=UPI001AC8173A|nr:PaaX family transcriptional regulator C-terminal domain-containing protein [Microbacterium sp.]MBN9177384.1 PaaX family transcriptional regulator [Microbacterium sp.]